MLFTTKFKGSNGRSFAKPLTTMARPLPRARCSDSMVSTRAVVKATRQECSDHVGNTFCRANRASFWFSNCFKFNKLLAPPRRIAFPLFRPSALIQTGFKCPKVRFFVRKEKIRRILPLTKEVSKIMLTARKPITSNHTLAPRSGIFTLVRLTPTCSSSFLFSFRERGTLRRWMRLRQDVGAIGFKLRLGSIPFTKKDKFGF